MPQVDPIIAVDIGNSRIKLGIFEKVERPFPTASRVTDFTIDRFDLSLVETWLRDSQVETRGAWWIASVNRAPTDRLIEWLQARGVGERLPGNKRAHPSGGYYHLISHTDLPLKVKVAEPQRVGIDRLVAAVAANHLRAGGRPAIVIDLGSAITVDLIDAEGAFLGGAILPGIGMSARAMNAFTDRLPLVPMEELADPPRPLGDNTVAAMRSGLYWGSIGAMKELVARLSAQWGAIDEKASDQRHFERALRESSGDVLDVFLTGGAASVVAQYVHPGAKWSPDLVLGGIALAATT
jgi:type III pantothenate kinase